MLRHLVYLGKFFAVFCFRSLGIGQNKPVAVQTIVDGGKGNGQFFNHEFINHESAVVYGCCDNREGYLRGLEYCSWTGYSIDFQLAFDLASFRTHAGLVISRSLSRCTGWYLIYLRYSLTSWGTFRVWKLY